MWATLRNTLNRGRSFEPEIRLRCRSWMRWRRSSLVLIFITLSTPGAPAPRSCPAGVASLRFSSCLAGLLLEHFAGVTNALLLVRIGLAESANVGRHLSDQLTIDACHGEVRLFVDRDVDPGGDVEHDRVRVPKREDHLLSLDFRPVA